MATRKRSGLGSGLANLIPSAQAEVKDSPVDVFFAPTDTQAEAAPTAKTKETSKASKAAGTTSKRKASQTKNAGQKARQATQSKIKDTHAGIDVGEGDLVAVPGVTYGELPIEQIIPNTRQPRTVFDEDELAELAESITQVGVLQPVIVRPLDTPLKDNPSARYELIMGERRWRASQLAGAKVVPAIVRRTADEDLLRDALLENLHRTQLNPLEEAAAYQQLLEDFSCTQEELSRRIARSRPQISNTIRLLKLPPLVQQRVAANIISAGHARALLSLPDTMAMEKLAQRIVAENLSVRQVEEYVATWDEPASMRTPKRRARVATPELDELATQLGDRLNTKVKVTMGARKGAIRIDFAGQDDLQRILAILAPDLKGQEPADTSPPAVLLDDKAYDLGY